MIWRAVRNPLSSLRAVKFFLFSYGFAALGIILDRAFIFVIGRYRSKNYLDSIKKEKSLRNIPHMGRVERVKQSPAKEQSLFRKIATRSRETGCARDDFMSLEEG